MYGLLIMLSSLRYCIRHDKRLVIVFVFTVVVLVVVVAPSALLLLVTTSCVKLMLLLAFSQRSGTKSSPSFVRRSFRQLAQLKCSVRELKLKCENPKQSNFQTCIAAR